MRDGVETTSFAYCHRYDVNESVEVEEDPVIVITSCTDAGRSVMIHENPVPRRFELSLIDDGEEKFCICTSTIGSEKWWTSRI